MARRRYEARHAWHGRRNPEKNRCSICAVAWRTVDRHHELEILRRSIAMLSPGVPALSREDALGLLGELTDVQSRLERLRSDLRRLLEE